MANQHEHLLTAIDVGSAKTCALAAEITDGGLRYRGHGVAESRGSRKGVIVDLDKAVGSIQKAVEQAEDAAGAPIEHAWLGIAGAHARGINSHGGLTRHMIFMQGSALQGIVQSCSDTREVRARSRRHERNTPVGYESARAASYRR